MSAPPEFRAWLEILHRSVVEWGLEDPARYEAITGTRVDGLGKGEHFRPNALALAERVLELLVRHDEVEVAAALLAGYEDDE